MTQSIANFVPFCIVRAYRGHMAKKKLDAYVKTLSPKQQQWANDPGRRLSTGTVSERLRELKITSNEIAD